MLKLSAPREPFWLILREAKGDEPAVRVQFKPHTVAARLSARRSAAREYKSEDAIQDERAAEAYTTALATAAIVAWEGIGNSDGEPVEPTPENVAMLLADPNCWDAVDRLYVAPILAEDAEKNASAPLPNGRSVKGAPTAPLAQAAAKRARKPSTSRKAKTAS